MQEEPRRCGYWQGRTHLVRHIRHALQSQKQKWLHQQLTLPVVLQLKNSTLFQDTDEVYFIQELSEPRSEDKQQHKVQRTVVHNTRNTE